MRQPVPAGPPTGRVPDSQEDDERQDTPCQQLMAVKRITPQGTISATARFRQISKPGTEAIASSNKPSPIISLYTLRVTPIANFT